MGSVCFFWRKNPFVSIYISLMVPCIKLGHNQISTGIILKWNVLTLLYRHKWWFALTEFDPFKTQLSLLYLDSWVANLGPVINVQRNSRFKGRRKRFSLFKKKNQNFVPWYFRITIFVFAYQYWNTGYLAGEGNKSFCTLTISYICHFVPKFTIVFSTFTISYPIRPNACTISYLMD